MLISRVHSTVYKVGATLDTYSGANERMLHYRLCTCCPPIRRMVDSTCTAGLWHSKGSHCKQLRAGSFVSTDASHYGLGVVMTQVLTIKTLNSCICVISTDSFRKYIIHCWEGGFSLCVGSWKEEHFPVGDKIHTASPGPDYTASYKSAWTHKNTCCTVIRQTSVYK